jgi:uncharacterized damage-inducible protein DinB
MQRTIKRLDRTHEKLIATIGPLSPAAFAQRPSENEWSVGEIVHHLYLVEDRVIKELEKALAGPPQQFGLLRRFVSTSIVAMRLVKVKAPGAMNPVSPPDKETNIANYDATRDKLKELCANVSQERLKKIVFKHPFLGTMSGAAAVSFLGYHELRHLKQIREALRKLK